MGLAVGPDPALALFSGAWLPVGVPGIRSLEPKVSTVLDFEQSIQHSIEGMCDSSTLGAPRVPKVSRVLHFEHLNLTGDVVGGPGGRSGSGCGLIFPGLVVGWGPGHPISRAKSVNSSRL